MANPATKSKPSFSSILDMPASEAQRPPTLPRGSYVVMVTAYREDKSSQAQTPFTEFTLKVIEPLEKEDPKTKEMVPQVDEDELEEFGDVRDSIINVRFWHTEKAIYRLREFLEHCGVDLGGKKSFTQAIPEAVNATIIANITHRPLQTGEGVRAEVRSTAPAE